METSPTVFLLALFIVKGLSLECEECLGIGDCSGNMVTCDLGKDRCSVTEMVLPMDLPEKAPANGKQCPACFALGKTCHEEVTDCTGDELYCAEGLLDSKMSMFSVEVSLKGCANKALCDSLVGYEAMAPENSEHHAMECTPDSSIQQQEFSTVGPWNNLTIIQGFSGGVNPIPRWFGLSLTILSGVLLRKFLA
ncbi:phospholipase A2 inhibitor NAI-like isoform X2 [Ahaetulla prasina]|uniref:phospholipase A2 inhibitor NAI-like isoform X2 n=1 Tax=Ahaetulla prasina TaxID=499056 RepID=UPI002649E29D|nr:phospholipase A2 inhibitor NAI-like isoform X2 [Ahaetulla prasina]